jgi:glutaredoxin
MSDAGCSRCLRDAEHASETRFLSVVGKIGIAAVVVAVGARAVSWATGHPAQAEIHREAPAAVAATAATAAALTAKPAPAPPPKENEGPLAEERIASEMKNVPVTIYAADYCQWCKKAKAHMDAHGIAYTERKVDQDPAAKREMQRLGGDGLPTIVIDSDVHTGYDTEWIDRTLRQHAEQRVAASR